MPGEPPAPAAAAGGWPALKRWVDAGRVHADATRGRRWANATATSVGLLAAVTVAVELLENHAPVHALSVLYLLAVVPVAVLWGMVFATAVSVVGVLSFGYLFLPPRGHLDLTESGNWFALVVFVFTAVVVSELAARSQREARALARLAEEQGALRRVATQVARQTGRQELDALISAEVGELLGADVAVMRHYEQGGGDHLMGRWTRGKRTPTPGCVAAVARVTELIAQTGTPARLENDARGGPGGDRGPSSAIGAPIIVEGQLWGAMIVASNAGDLPQDTSMRLTDFTALVGIAIANAKNRADLAASRQRVVLAADETRRRIERDLHDGAQQQLVALAIDLQTMQENVPPELPHLRAELMRIAQGLIGTLDELREIARGIHPAILVQGGLDAALRTLARRCPVPVELDLDLDSRFPEPIEVAAYYVVAEALTNAARHADASLIRVTGDVRDGVLHVDVQDDGRGGAAPTRGSGLVGIIDRVEALGGTLVLRSPVGAGTSIALSLPVGQSG